MAANKNVQNYHFEIKIWRVDASEKGRERLNAKDDSVIEEERVGVGRTVADVTDVVVVVAKLLIAPEEDDAEVVVQT